MEDLSEIRISYHPIIQPGMLPKITVTFQAFQLFLDHWDMGLIHYVEQVKVMYLNSDYRVLGIYSLSSGGFTECVLDFRPAFIGGLMSCATSMIIAHNHPSGNLEISKADRRCTRQMVKAGKLIGIEVVDHLIITSDFYVGFRDKKLIK